jgi:DNA-binding IscR family transcriptional regulator
LKFLLHVRLKRKCVVAKQISQLLNFEPSSLVMWVRELRDAGLIDIGKRTRKGPNPGCDITLTKQALTLLMKANIPMTL